MKFSKYQQDVFQAIITTKSNIAVKAAPGSGKTTTIVEAAKLIPYGKSSVFVAFNKSIVEELKSRLPKTTDCSTMHSIGFKAIANYYYMGKVILKESKQVGFIMPYFDQKNNKEKWGAIYAVDRLITLARATMAKVNKEGMNNVVRNYALDIEEEWLDKAVQALEDIYKYNDSTFRTNIEIDYLDMIQIPVRNEKMRLPQYDYVFLDECQDMSAQDHVFLSKLVKPITGRMIGVGDEHQSIYGFRGSSPDSFATFASKPNTITLPLSISYRCPKSVVREAAKIYSDIEPYIENEEGVVRKGTVQEIQEGDFVLCRNTRPLIDVFFHLLDQGKKAYIVGSEMEKGLLSVLGCCESSDEREVAVGKLNALKIKALSDLKAKGITNPINHPKIEILTEKLDILCILFNKFANTHEVEQFIKKVFDDENRRGVVLTTIHKAKGRENDRVFIIDTYDGKKLIPSAYAVTRDQKVQERNLQFVSYTRSKKELVFLNL